MKSLVYKTIITHTVMSAVFKLLHSLQLHTFEINKPIVIKPNIMGFNKPPKITSPLVVHAIVEFIKTYFPTQDIIIAEGCANPQYTMKKLFDIHGYNRLKGVELIDLNTTSSTKFLDDSAKFLKEFYISDILHDCFLINVPVLKGHGLVGFTGCLKNLFGIAPAYIYKVKGHGNKYLLHKDIPNAIIDINRYVKPDLHIIDASIGLMYHHSHGTNCNPPLNTLFGGFDPVAIDVCTHSLVSLKQIDYLNDADGIIGNVQFKVIEC